LNCRLSLVVSSKCWHVVVRIFFLSGELLSNVEVDRVEVHVVGGSGESQTRHRVEQVSGKVCAIIVTVDPPSSGGEFVAGVQEPDPRGAAGLNSVVKVVIGQRRNVIVCHQAVPRSVWKIIAGKSSANFGVSGAALQ